MWQRINSEESALFFQCIVDEAKNMVKCLWSEDLAQMWIERLSLQEALDRAVALNRKIEYTKEIIFSTIANAPETFVRENATNEADPSKSSMQLKFKYTINQLPFVFTWEMNVCSREEYFRSLMEPLLLTVSCLQKQNNDLRKLIILKDVELKQYQDEGAVLKRTLVATQPFDPDEFDKKYPKTENGQIVKYSTENFEQLKRNCGNEKEEIEQKVSPIHSKIKNVKSPSARMYLRIDRRKRVRMCAGKAIDEDSSSSSDEFRYGRDHYQSRRRDPPKSAKKRLCKRINF